MKVKLKSLFIRLSGMMVILLAAGELFGQQATITVIDAKTKEIVPFATVCFQGLKSNALKQMVTDIKGLVPNSIMETSKVAVTFIGYETLLDTIQPRVSITLALVPAVMNMSEFVVTGQFKPEKADKSIYKIHVINSKQIERKAATNLTDLLSSESNMRISQSGAIGANLSFMGLSGENVKILIDGVPVIGRLDGKIDLNQLNLYNVDHVEIIEGPMSVIYGSNAIGGVVNIITKENKSNSLSAFANAYYETAGQYNLNGGGSVHHNRSSYSLDFGRNFFDGYSAVDTARAKTWSPKLQYNANGYYLYSTNKMRVKASVQYFNEFIQANGNLEAPYYETAFDKKYHTIRQTSKAEAAYVFSANQQLSLVAAFQTFNRKQDFYFNDLTKLQKSILTSDTTIVQSLYLRTLLDSYYLNQKLNNQLGFEGNREMTGGARILGSSQQIGDYAVFLNVKYNPNTKISIQPGIRGIYNTKYKAPLVYSMNLKYSLTKNSSFRATFARGFRSPTVKELYIDFVDINHDVHGNPELVAESSYNSNFNFSYNREMPSYYLNTEITLFYNNVDNMIDLLHYGSDIKSYTYINVAKFISQGFEWNSTVNFYPRLTFRGGFSLIGRKYPSTEQSSLNQVFHYSTDFNLMFTYNFEKYNASLTTNFKITSKYPQLSPDATFNNDYIDGYPSLDISLVKNVLQNRVTVSVGGKNLFNVTDVNSGLVSSGGHSGSSGASVIAWGRTAFVKLAFNFKKS